MANLILLFLLSITQVLGDIWLSKAMKQFGKVNVVNPENWIPLIGYLLTNFWIWLGVIFLMISLGLYLTVISKFDLSYVLSMHSSTYLLNALFAWLILGETISNLRWIGTLIITIGVLIVGLSKPLYEDRQNHNFHILLMALSFSFYRSNTWLAIAIIALADSTGDLCLARGMKEIGEVNLQSMKNIVKQVGKIIINPLIIGGVFCQTIAFLSLISVLSWADVSFVRPATALTYVCSILGAKIWLKEKVSQGRFIGIIFIVIGLIVNR
ncbi:EamA family transporter [Okeania sp. SIO2B3]|uniref:EamA family transporter n=1 Tax=Okeania sp. SIO2B3 TaxID=2607784 RepID=UPI0025D1E304|nr:EamA family transporter [Okeania sp. SIO2B3]